MSPFWPLLGAHVLGDMVFNSSRLAVCKRDARISRYMAGIAGHCLVHAGFAAALLALSGWPALLGAALVFAQHFLIDFCRCFLEKKIYGPARLLMNRAEIWEFFRGRRRQKLPEGVRLWAGINVCDQSAHIACLFAISRLLRAVF